MILCVKESLTFQVAAAVEHAAGAADLGNICRDRLRRGVRRRLQRQEEN